MQNLPTKSTGDQYTAAEFNVNQDERENAVTDSGQTLGGDDFQSSRAMSVNTAGADYYDDSGAADAYVLSKPGTSSLRSPPAYFEGMRIRFRPSNNNTGASTVNVTAVGVKNILRSDGSSAVAGDLTTTQDTVARFDLTLDAFLIMATVPASTVIKGIVELATPAENAAGTSDLVIPTSKGIREAFNAAGSAPVYACRAWVNFKGSGLVSIRASGNVSSITDNGPGNYTVNFTTNMADVNYGVLATAGDDINPSRMPYVRNYLVDSVDIIVVNIALPSNADAEHVNVAIFR